MKYGELAVRLRLVEQTRLESCLGRQDESRNAVKAVTVKANGIPKIGTLLFPGDSFLQDSVEHLQKCRTNLWADRHGPSTEEMKWEPYLLIIIPMVLTVLPILVQFVLFFAVPKISSVFCTPDMYCGVAWTISTGTMVALATSAIRWAGAHLKPAMVIAYGTLFAFLSLASAAVLMLMMYAPHFRDEGMTSVVSGSFVCASIVASSFLVRKFVKILSEVPV